MTSHIKGILIALFILAGGTAMAADSTGLEKNLLEILNVPCTTGSEEMMSTEIISRIPDSWTSSRSRLGHVIVNSQGRSADTIVMTGLDHPGYFVSGITADGFLRLDRAAPPPHPLYDRFLFGHPLTVWSQKGAVHGVVAVPSVHLLSAEQRRNLADLLSLDHAYLDIGAESEPQSRERGIRLLDPVTSPAELVRLAGGKISAPDLGRRMCTSILLTTLQNLSGVLHDGTVSFVWAAQSLFPARRSTPRSGIGPLQLSKKLNCRFLLFIDAFPETDDPEPGIAVGKGPVLFHRPEVRSSLAERIEQICRQQNIPLQHVSSLSSLLINPFLNSSSDICALLLPVKFAGTPAEVCDRQDPSRLQRLLKTLCEKGDRP